jgi:apolipoprotein N-acyltransferase
MIRFARPAAAGLAGGLLARGLAPWQDLWLVPVALAGFSFLLLTTGAPRARVWQGWLFGVGYFAMGMSWIVEPFQVDAERHAWMAPFALLFLSGGLALFWAAAVWGAGRMGQTGWRFVLALTLTFSLAEFARAYLLTGLPWAAFGQFWIDTPLALLLPWAGPQGLALLTVFAGLSLGLIPLPSVRVRARIMAAAPAVALMLVAVLLPEPPLPEMSGKTVRLIQPNAPQDQKWDPAYMGVFFHRQLEFTAAPAAGPKPDLVIWPETAIPVLLEDADHVFERISGQAAGAPVVLGLLRTDQQGSYNSLAVLDGQGGVSGVYDKHHLVPFGEYVPLSGAMEKLGITGLAQQIAGGFRAGPGARLLEISGIGTALPLICYEAVFPQDVNAVDERPGFLMQITNDAWFGTWSGPYQHLVQARMRAMEQGLPMARAANTGVSAMIGPYGRVLDQLPLGMAGYLDAALPRALPETLYRRTGDWPVLIILLLGLAAMQFLHGRNAFHRNPAIKD